MNNNNNKQQMSEDYNRAAGSSGAQPAKAAEDGKPVLDAVSPMVLLVVVFIIIAFLGLLGWGVIIVFGM